MTWTTITAPRKRVKSMKRHVQITNSLPSRSRHRRRRPLSLGEFCAFFSCFHCVMGMIVWIVRDVESDVLVLWFDGIKTNIDGKYCYINRLHTYSFISKDREILSPLLLLLLQQSNDSHNLQKQNKINWQKQQSKKFPMCVSMWRELIRIEMCVCMYVCLCDHRSPWLILGYVLFLFARTMSHTHFSMHKSSKIQEK